MAEKILTEAPQGGEGDDSVNLPEGVEPTPASRLEDVEPHGDVDEEPEYDDDHS